MRLKAFGVAVDVDYFAAAVVSLMLVLDKSGVMLWAIAAVAMHEAGHTAVLLLCSGSVARVRLCPWGIEIDRRTRNLSTAADIAVAAAGPFANLAAFALLWRVQPQAAAVNFINGAFSLLPCLGLDGGDIAFAALCRVFGPRAAQITLEALTVAVAAALTALGARLFIDAGNPTLCLTGLYLGAAELLKSTSRL